MPREFKPIEVPMPASVAYKNAILCKISQRTNSLAIDGLTTNGQQWPNLVGEGQIETERKKSSEMLRGRDGQAAARREEE